MWGIFLIAALLTGLVMGVLFRPRGGALPGTRWVMPLFPVAALGLYLALGRPDLPARPQLAGPDEDLRALFLLQQPLEELRARDPKNPQVIFFEGLRLLEGGDDAGAILLWQGLLADAPKDAPWAGPVRAMLERIRKEGGQN